MPSENQFEEPLVELRRRIEELEGYPAGSGHEREIERLRRQLAKDTRTIFSNLTAWQTALVARHPERPYTLDYIHALTEDWVELHGDRAFADDAAVVAGLALFDGVSVAIVGHQKGRGTRGRIHRNFGQPRPEGIRKALRVMKIAEKFQLPVICFVDTPGAYPGVGGEERGQAEAIARNLIEMASLRVPILVIVAGEGGSGGALAMGVGDRIAMLQHAVYSVISPEGCAAILWRDQEGRSAAAAAMKITAADLLDLGIIDEVVPEPLGGAHADPATTFDNVGSVLRRYLSEVRQIDIDRLVPERRQRFRRLGVFREA